MVGQDYMNDKYSPSINLGNKMYVMTKVGIKTYIFKKKYTFLKNFLYLFVDIDNLYCTINTKKGQKCTEFVFYVPLWLSMVFLI